MKKFVMLIGIISVLLLTGCTREITGSPETDGALNSFNDMEKSNKDLKGFHHAMGHWGLTMEDGNKFEWAKDTALTQADFAIVLQTKPFVEAGLKLDDLSAPYVFKPEAEEGGMMTPDLILATYNISDKKETAQGSKDAMRRLLKQDNQLVKLDTAEKLYRLNMSQGVQVSWIDKDQSEESVLTFYLPAEPLEKSGLNLEKIQAEGWTVRPAGEDALGTYPTQIYKSYILK